MPDIMKIETLSRRSEITPEDLIRALNLKIITREEMVAFGKTVQAHEDHYLHELREDFENKSKTESSASYCHKVNLYRADKLEEYFKGTPMAQITPEAIDTYRVGRLKTVCQTTVNHDLKILRKYLDIAVSKGWITANTARVTKLMKEPRAGFPGACIQMSIRCFSRSSRTTSISCMVTSNSSSRYCFSPGCVEMNSVCSRVKTSNYTFGKSMSLGRE
jgi:hypothetical protein